MRNLRLVLPVAQYAKRVTPRESQVLALAHLPNAQIAQQLGISRETVKAHLANASLKLGAENRTAAVLLWMERAA